LVRKDWLDKGGKMKPGKCSCGSKRVYLCREQKGEYVHCSKCKTNGEFFFTDHKKNKNAAVESWNASADKKFDDENTAPIAKYERETNVVGRWKYGLFDIAK
jgi:hypothetical protein